jgi:threonyl-tRNA synthetase
LVTVNQEEAITGCADKIFGQARALGVRAMVDDSNESVGKKIRTAEVMKVPYVVVIGQKEIETGKLVPRIRKDIEVGEAHEQHTVEEFLKTVANEAKSRVIRSSL